MKRAAFRCLLILSVLLAALLFQAALAEDTTHIVILGTSDMHGNVWGWTYENGTETSNNGMARLYTYIRRGTEKVYGVVRGVLQSVAAGRYQYLL